MTEAEIEDLRDVLSTTYPELVVVGEKGIVRIRGTFPIVHDGEVLDKFLMELRVPPNFPKEIPILREIGGRVPCIPDRHTNSNGDSCPLVPEEWLLLPREKRTVLTFLDGPVRNFFLFQALKERGQPWPWGERSHGRQGLLEAYGELVGMRTETAIVKCLGYLTAKKIKGHWSCPCGSGRSLRDCHLVLVRSAQARVPRAVAASALRRLQQMN